MGAGRQTTARRATAGTRRRSGPGNGSRGGAKGSRRRLARLGRRRFRLRPRALLALVALAAVAAGAWMWLRSSSLVAVQKVTVAGLSGPDARQIRAALTGAARGMTTLDVQMAPLRSAVAPYPVVKHLEVSTSFPHGMQIHVVEQVPVAEIATGSGPAAAKLVVAGDGTLLRHVSLTERLPTLSLPAAPSGDRVTGRARDEVRLLAAAPYAALAKIDQVLNDPAHGLAIALHDGPRIYFGSATQLAAKWSAALGVLASPSSAGASYIDVTDPSRPAAGTGADTLSAGSPSTGSAAGGAGSGSAAGSASGVGSSTASGGGAGSTPGAGSGTATGASPGATVTQGGG